jgi:hypothetical protein
MSTITISKKTYKELLEKKLRYERMREVLEEDIFGPPPTRKAKEVVAAFRDIGKYNAGFLKSLERGLRQSSYFKK